MRALTVTPGQSGSLSVEDMPEPDEALGDVLVDGLAVGVCGTDHELAELFDVVPVLDAQASLYLLCGMIAIVFLGSRRVSPRPGDGGV